MQPYTVEANYQYSPLPEGHIRLLQLLPHRDITAPVQGVIFDYPLLKLLRSAHHLYEALSYAWGSLEKSRLISINGYDLPVTTNLYSALLHLRDPLLQRTLWIDAICINQEDKDERRLQVQFMAMIYTMASHVTVWLGEAEDDGKRALGEIHRAAYFNEQPTEYDSMFQNAVLELLQQPWFKRVWVLQEVAAARNILIMYGSIEIDGHTFCLGVNALSKIYKGNSDLESNVLTALYLIGRTASQPKETPRELRKFSLNISTLAELLDMYHSREASDRHDKIYALLGMSSDGYSSGGFSPDYTTFWSSLFQQVIQFILGGKQISIKTWDNKDVAVINSKGYTLGKVAKAHLVENSGVWEGRQTVIISKAKSDVLDQDQHEFWDNDEATQEDEEDWNDVWTLNLLAKPIQPGDILCLLQGAAKPTLIRPYKGYFIIIAISVSPIAIRPAKKKINSWPDILYMIVEFPREFLLIWDWKEISSSFEDNGAGGPLNHQALKYGEIDLEDISDERELLVNTALILGDVTTHERAEFLMKKAIEGYKWELGDEHPRTLTAMKRLAWIYKKSYHLGRHGRFPESILLKEGEKLEAMAGILGREGYYRRMTTMKVAHLTRTCDEEVIKLLLDRRGSEITINETITIAATRNKFSNKEVLALLFDRRGDEVAITEKVMKAIASRYKSHDNSDELLKLFLDRHGDKITITKGIINADVGNNREFIALLLERHRDQIVVGENTVPIIAKHYSSLVMTSLLDWQEENVTITEKVMKGAAKNVYGGEVLKLFLDRRGDEISITENIIEAAAKSDCGNKTMKVLLDYERDHITITERIIKAAAGNWRNGHAIMRLLLRRQGGTIIITKRIAEAAANNNIRGKTVMALLLNQQRDQSIITEDAIPIVVEEFDKEVVLLLLRRGRNKTVWKEDAISIITKRYDAEVLEVFLLQQQNHFTITSGIMKAAAGNYHSERVMNLLLDQQGDKVTITDEIVKIATENEKSGIAILQVLLARRGSEIILTEEILKAMAKDEHEGSEKPIKQLLDQRGDEIKITEGVMKAAAKNRENGIAILQLFLSQRGGEITITEDIIVAATENVDKTILQLLLDQQGDEFMFTRKIVNALLTSLSYKGEPETGAIFDRYKDKIPVTEDIVKAIAGHPNVYGGTELMKLLLDQRGDEITITEEIAKAAARNNKDLMIMLLREREDEITVTNAILQAATKNHYPLELFELLLDQCEYKITITEETIQAMLSKHTSYSYAMIQLLLDRQGDKLPITEEIILAATKTSGNLESELGLILRRYGDKIHITEDLIKTMATNGCCKAMQFLFDERGDEVAITENIFQAVAATSAHHSTDMMKLLLHERGEGIIITENMFKAVAANNSHYSKNLMELLLEERGGEIIITENIFEAVTANESDLGKEMVEQLLDERGHEIRITEETIKIAAGNEKNGKKLMKLLINFQREATAITKEVVEVAVVNRGNGQEILKFLLDRRGDKVIMQEEALEIANRWLLQNWQED